MMDLAPYATFSTRSRGRRFAEPLAEGRSEFQRDRDRILHASAFRKLQYKTQVFINHEGDYYRTRLTHSLEVAQISRTIARILKLDEDLAEAVALAHDMGHTCFGHTGEYALQECMKPYGGFYHNDQTLRVVTHLEERYAAFDGLNLTWETVEGIVKHNGPLRGAKADPTKAQAAELETTKALDAAWPLELETYAGLEAQIAAIADDIAYTAHDIDDGLRGQFFTLADLEALALIGPIQAEVREAYPDIAPKRLRSEMHRRLINRLVIDVVGEAKRRLAAANPLSVEDVRHAAAPFVQFSDGLKPLEREVRAFLWKNLYRHYRVNRMQMKAKRVVVDLFNTFLERTDVLPTHWQPRAPMDAPLAQRARVVADYVAGMTDRFAMQEHRRLFEMEEQA